MDRSSTTHLSETASASIKKTRYKAKIDSVSPDHMRNTFESIDTCFLGISLENNNFKREKLKGIVEWISRRFSHCTVLIGDSIHRLTLTLLKDYPSDKALSVALQLGKCFINDNNDIFNQYSTTKFSFLTCHELQDSSDYSIFHNSLVALYKNNVNFNQSVIGFSRKFQNNKTVNIANNRIEKLNISVSYFLEEFAIFACLKKQYGISVMVYPGSFSTLTEIAQGKHPDAPLELKEMTVVSLCLKGKQR